MYARYVASNSRSACAGTDAAGRIAAEWIALKLSPDDEDPRLSARDLEDLTGVPWQAIVAMERRMLEILDWRVFAVFAVERS